MRNAQQLALVKRGGCNWSEKVSVVNDLASLNNLNVSTIFIYDNVTYQDIQVSTTPISGTGSASPSGSASSLPAPRNVLNMADNDLVSFTAYPTIYFVPNTYGESLVQHVNAMYNSTTPYIRYYWSITPYFDKVAWGDLRNFFSTSKGYIAYIIILVVVFIIGKNTHPSYIMVLLTKYLRQLSYSFVGGVYVAEEQLTIMDLPTALDSTCKLEQIKSILYL